MTITMYGADWCGDCLRSKAWLEANGIPYTYEPPLSDGGRIPVIEFGDGSTLTEPSDAELEAKINELGDQVIRVVENTKRKRFELTQFGEVLSYAEYSGNNGAVVVPHVVTAPQHRGKGNAAVLMESLLGLLKTSGRTIVPVCSYAVSYLAEHTEHHDLVAAR